MVVGGFSGRHAHVAAMFLGDYICIVSSAPSREEHRLTGSPENIPQFIYTRPSTSQMLFSGQVILQKDTSGGPRLVFCSLSKLLLGYLPTSNENFLILIPIKLVESTIWAWLQI